MSELASGKILVWSAPAVRLKKLVTMVVAVNAMARPKTMPVALRIAEPSSAKAKPNPVMTMAMTPTVLAAGLAMEFMLVVSGPSYGMAVAAAGRPGWGSQHQHDAGDDHGCL